MPFCSSCCCALAPGRTNNRTAVAIRRYCGLLGSLNWRLRALFPSRIAASLWLEEELVRIRTVNRSMAHGAGLILLGLIMEGRNRGCSHIRGKCVALKAQQVHLCAFEKPRIGTAVRRMAGNAPFGLHRRMLVYERPRFVAVALKAGGVLRCRDTELPALKSAVRIVAIIALHEPFVHAMVEGARELLLDLQMAAVTKLGGFLLHQELTFLGVVWAVAVRASDVVF